MKWREIGSNIAFTCWRPPGALHISSFSAPNFHHNTTVHKRRDTMVNSNKEALVLAKGLAVAGYGEKKLALRTQHMRFKQMYGCLPIVVEHIWHDLQGRLPAKAKLDHLFWALFFLKRYPTEGDMALRLKKDPNTIRKWVWALIFGIQDLKAEKVREQEVEHARHFIFSFVTHKECIKDTLSNRGRSCFTLSHFR